jgi:hypothetical protein
MGRPLRLLAACVAFVSAPAFAQNLVQNGSFESPALAPGNWGVYAAIPDWTLVSGGGGEIQNNVAGAPYTGAQHVELDGYDNSAIEQAVPVVPGATYLFTWAYSPRPGVASASNGVEVLVDGNVIGISAADGTANTETVWTVYQLLVPANGPTITLRFRAGGTSDGAGGYIDGVALSPVAAPPAKPVDATSDAMLAMMVLALAAAGALALTRRG